MNSEFIFQIAVFLSLGAIIYLLARVLPRLERDRDKESDSVSSFDKLIGRLPLTKIDSTINNFLSKILRRLKVVILKADNLVTNYSNKLKKTSGNGKIESSSSALSQEKKVEDTFKSD